ncbi:MAG: helix-turn-helix domain-containing protein [Myxococcota bacterium]
MSNSADKRRRRALVPVERCPMAQAAILLGDRWMLLILREAFYGVVRYDDMIDDLGISRSVLTDRLARLVEAGVLERRAYREPSARTRDAYVLTDSGRQLAPVFVALTEWGEVNALRRRAPVVTLDRQSGAQVRCRLVDEDGEPVPIERLVLKKR